MIKRLCFIALIITTLLLTQSSWADIFYVASDGFGISPYDTWAKAATDPQVAIELANVTAGGPHQVWMRRGVYNPQFNPHTDTPIQRKYCFALRNNVEIYGGFAGGETLLSQRDYVTNQTIFSGDRGDPDRWANGTAIVKGGVFNPPPTGDPSQDLPVMDNSTNCYHVIYNPDQEPDLDTSALLDGIIVTGAYSLDYDGGGIYNKRSSPTLTNCTISGNSASCGGGVYNYNFSTAHLTNCTISGNSAENDGGGVYNYDYSTTTLTNCTISGNSADDGGGVCNDWNSTVTLTNCTISENSASHSGGGVSNTASCTATLTNCTFSENTSSSGGGLYGSVPTATDCIFWGNYGGEFAGFIDYSNIRYCIASGDLSGFGEGCLNSNPDLGSFGDYGGLTECYSIPSDSSAVNIGANVYRVTSDNDILIYLSRSSGNYIKVEDGTIYDIAGQTLIMLNSHDQRGRERSEPVDIGSYEYIAGSSSPWNYDYNGDGTSDIAIFRGDSGLWSIRGITRVYFGASSDLLVPGDYNGNATTDIGIYRPSSGLWAIKGVTRTYFGSSSDTTVPGDYNGNGRCDMAIYRSALGLWAIRGVTRVYFGSSVDLPASGYYDNNATKDIGIFRGSSGLWAIRGISRVYFGRASDRIIPGDYDGDGEWDYGIFRGSSGLWAIRGNTRSYFGSGVDQPVPANYRGDGRDDIGIFRESSGLWAIRGISRVYFGASGDVPVTR